MTVARHGKQGATVLCQNFMAAYGAEWLNLTGHSRGAMTIGNAMGSLAKDSGSSGVLSNTRLKFVGPAYNAQEAANLLGWLSNGTSTLVTLQNHADDFVGNIVGGNPATYDQRPGDSNRVKEWIRIFGDAPTVHSCYGTGDVNKGGRPNYGFPTSIDIQSNRNK